MGPTKACLGHEGRPGDRLARATIPPQPPIRRGDLKSLYALLSGAPRANLRVPEILTASIPEILAGPDG
jgi:hypothetical protein